MDPRLMSLPEVQSKNRRICSDREVQKNDVMFRRRVRKIVVQELNYHEELLRKLLQPTSRAATASFEPNTTGASSISSSIACTMEDLRELRAVLHQLSIDDDLSDAHWKQHFSIVENKLSHDERKFLRSFSPTTMIAEVPRRTKSPVERAQQHEERLSATSHHDDNRQQIMRSSSFVLRGDTSAKVDPPLFQRKLSHVPLSRVFRVAENGKRGQEARRCFTPLSPTKSTEQHEVREIKKKSLAKPVQVAKENNNLALGMMQKNALRDAHNCLAETLKLLDTQAQSDERDAVLAITHCNIANCYRRSGNFSEAMAHLQTCAEIELSCLGDAAPSTIINLGALHLQMGDVANAVSLVEQLQRSLRSKKEGGEHISRHLFALCEEHLHTCELYVKSIQRDQSAMQSRLSTEASQDSDNSHHGLRTAALEYDSYITIIEDIKARRRERREYLVNNSTGASHMEWRSISPVTFEEQRHDYHSDHRPPPASVRIGELDDVHFDDDEVAGALKAGAVSQDPVVESELPPSPNPPNSIPVSGTVNIVSRQVDYDDHRHDDAVGGSENYEKVDTATTEPENVDSAQ
jgi:tetratricopeptide (TPR) repeat protein